MSARVFSTGNSRLAARFTSLLQAVGLALCLLGFAALLASRFGAAWMMEWKTGARPMAPVAAALALIDGIVIQLIARRSDSPSALRVARVLATLGAVVAVVVTVALETGAAVRLQLLVSPLSGFALDSPDWRLAGMTLLSLAAVNLALVSAAHRGAQRRRELWLQMAAGALALLTGGTILLFHLFGTPAVLHQNPQLPALATGVMLLLLGVALVGLGLRLRGSLWLVDMSDGMQSGPVLVSIFIGVSTITLLGGYAYYRSEERQFLAEAAEDLISVSHLKVNVLHQWRQERLGDGAVIAGAAPAALMCGVLGDPRSPFRPLLAGTFASYDAYRQYDRIYLLDETGRVHLSWPPDAGPPSPPLLAVVKDARVHGRAALTDFYTDSEAQAHLALVVPFSNQGPGRTCAGMVVLRVDPRLYLYPLVQGWPVPSDTAESFLVQKDGNDALYLSHLRRDPNAAMHRRASLSQPVALASRAGRGERGSVDGVDFRGMPVTGFVAEVPGSPWIVVSRIERAEIDAAMLTSIVSVSGFIFLLLSGAGMALALSWRSQHARFRDRQTVLSEQLRAGDERLRLALEGGSQGLWDLDLEHGTAVTSPEYASMLGYDPSDLVETVETWRARLHADDVTPAMATLEAIARGERLSYSAECRLRKRDGSYLWVLSQGRVVARLPNGMPKRMLGTHTDISVLKASESRAQRYANLYAALSHTNTAIVRCRSTAQLLPLVCEGAVTYGGFAMAWVGMLNDAGTAIDVVEVYGQGSDEVRSLAMPISQDGPTRCPTATAIREGRPVWIDDFGGDPSTVAWHERAGRYGWGAAAALPLTRGDRVIGGLSLFGSSAEAFDDSGRALLTEMASDISFALTNMAREAEKAGIEERLEESERRYRRLFDEGGVPMLVLDPETGRIVDANRAASSFYGWQIDTLRSKNISEINLEGPVAVRGHLADVLSHGTRSFRFQHQLADGRIREGEASAVRVDVENQPRIHATIIDVTERNQALAALHASLDEKEALLKEVHHRVKNNLQVITSLLRLEGGRSPDERVRTVLSDMQSRVLSMALLHETLYRSDNLAQVDLSVYLNQLATQLFRSMAPPSGVTLALELSPLMVDLDSAIPCGLLVNELMSNALKHGFPDGRRGEVRVQLESVAETGSLRLTVSDTGVGLPDNFEERRTSSLGLQLVTSLARQLQGALDIAHGPGGRFSLTFVPRSGNHTARR